MFQKYFRNAPVLVTGGAGFIGSHLVEALVAHGAKVRVLDNFATGYRSNLNRCLDRIELIEGDLRDMPTCRRLCEGVRFVWHEAALGSVPRSMAEPDATMAVNVGGTANLFTAARDAEVDRVVYASSSSVYGDSEGLPKREGEEGRPQSPYALSKCMNEQLAEMFARCFGMTFVGLRYFNVYGPRQDPSGPYAAVIPKFFDAFEKGESPTIFGDGLQSRDFTFVEDVIQANLAAMISPLSGASVFNIGAAGATRVLDLAEAIGRITGSDLAPRHEAERPGDVRHSRADISAAQRHLDYRPRTSIDQGLARTHAQVARAAE